jgi:hypothetical protein
MILSDALTRSPALNSALAWLAARRGALLLILAFSVATFVVRTPTFLEPAWHTDEGIFAAVSQRVVTGGSLYADAWESKPPLFLYLYAGVNQLFGPEVLPLRLLVALAALATQLALFRVALHLMPRRQAIIAAVVLMLLLAVPFWEGNLAVTESFTILPATLGVLAYLRHERRSEGGGQGLGWLIGAGVLFGAAVLLRQTAAVVAIALVLWLIVSGRPWLRPTLVMGLSAGAVLAATTVLFAVLGSFYWFWDANAGFFFLYIPAGREIAFYERPLIVLPVLAAVTALIMYRRRGEAPAWGLPALWLTLTLAASLLTGRPYSHYFLQVLPPLALLVGLAAASNTLTWRPRTGDIPGLATIAAVVLLWVGVVMPAFEGNVLAMRYSKAEDYYANFAGRMLGLKSEYEYKDYFDRRVHLTEALAERLRQLGSEGEGLYVWGEYPWVYALSRSEPATRYMTSFYLLIIPGTAEQLGETLAAREPRFIVIMDDAWPRTDDPEGVGRWRFDRALQDTQALIAERYEHVEDIGVAHIYRLADR